MTPQCVRHSPCLLRCPSLPGSGAAVPPLSPCNSRFHTLHVRVGWGRELGGGWGVEPVTHLRLYVATSCVPRDILTIPPPPPHSPSWSPPPPHHSPDRASTASQDPAAGLSPPCPPCSPWAMYPLCPRTTTWSRVSQSAQMCVCCMLLPLALLSPTCLCCTYRFGLRVLRAVVAPQLFFFTCALDVAICCRYRLGLCVYGLVAFLNLLLTLECFWLIVLDAGKVVGMQRSGWLCGIRSGAWPQPKVCVHTWRGCGSSTDNVSWRCNCGLNPRTYVVRCTQ